MSIFICPNCEQCSEIAIEAEEGEMKHVCPNCGHEFTVSCSENIIIESKD